MRFSSITLFTSLALVSTLAGAQPFEVNWFTIDAGGGTVGAGSFDLAYALGQPDASEPLNGGSFVLTSGFFAGLVTPPNCSPADLAEPYGMLNFFDVSAFLQAFTAQSPQADFNNDGQFNFFDVSAFLSAYGAGCS
jgi:hypothetical protein